MIMKSALKISGLFTIFIFVLSIRIRGKTIFDGIYQVISPATIAAQKATENFFMRSISGTQSYSKKMFDNSIPNLKDSVKSKLASPKADGVPQEVINVQEKEELNDLIKNHR
jgi:hypothetical protein